MSKISTIYDQLVNTTIPSLTGFNSKTRISNPFEIEKNDLMLLKNGWGLKLGPASDSPFQEFNKTKVTQVFSIVLTRQVIKTQHNYTNLDTAVKLLKEDALLVRLDFYNADQLGLDSSIELITFSGESEIEYIDDEFEIIVMQVDFNFEINENI